MTRCTTTDGVAVDPGQDVWVYDPELDDQEEIRPAMFQIDGTLRCEGGYEWNDCYSTKQAAEEARNAYQASR